MRGAGTNVVLFVIFINLVLFWRAEPWLWRRIVAAEVLLFLYTVCGGGSWGRKNAARRGNEPPLDMQGVMANPELIPGIKWGESPCLRSAPSLESTWCIIPHPTKVDKGGEDAIFLTPLSAGCADGVGGWAARGIDAGLYSSSLMTGAERVALQGCAALQGSGGFGGSGVDKSSDASKLEMLHPVALMKCGYDDCCRQRIVGSSTACIVALLPRALSDAAAGQDSQRIVHSDEAAEREAAAQREPLCVCVGNLGDSGAMLLRDGQVVFRTEEQTHGFNFPRQLGTGSQDTPNDADVITIDALPGDIIIVASDGVWDNLFDDDVRTYLAQRQALNSQMLARDLALHAYCRARDRSRVSPFVRRGVEAGCLDKKKIESGMQSGGKVDDISIIVSTITDPADALTGHHSTR